MKTMFIDEITGQVFSKNRIVKPEVIVIASSTGGPKALDVIYSKLPKDFDVPIVIVQHIIGNITSLLANTPKEKYNLPISVPVNGEQLEKGKIYIAGGGAHLVASRGIGANAILKYKQTPTVNSVIPAADVTFTSVAKIFAGKNILALVLTGIGKDGVEGVRKLKETTNCLCICESQSTCTIYGMSRNTIREGLSDIVLPIDEIGDVLQMVLTR